MDSHVFREEVLDETDFDRDLDRESDMRVQSTSSQANQPAQTEAARNAGPATRTSAGLAVFDSSAHASTDGDSRAGTAKSIASLTPIGNPPFRLPAFHADKSGAQLRADANNRGVYKDDRGATFIRQDAQTYPVRYDKDNGTWRVHSPANQTKYQYPVKQDENGTWRTHGEVGLPGGWKGAPPAGGGWEQQAVMQAQHQVQHLENQRQQLQQQRQDLQNQLQQFPGPQHANRSPLEQAMLQSMMQTQLANLGHQLQAVEQQLQQANQQLQQLQNDLQ